MDDRQMPLGFKDFHSAAHRFNAKRLTLARELKGLTKVELANSIGKTPSALTQFEAGAIKPDPKTVAELALSLGVPVGFFATTTASPALTGDGCNFRKLRSASQRERKRVLAIGTLVCDIAALAEEHVAIPPEQVSGVSKTVRFDDDIEELAIEVRKAWNLGLGPIPDLLLLLEKQGIIISMLPERSEEVEAFSTWHNGRPMIFLVSDRTSSSRIRFDAAHELGHLVMHADVSPGDPELERQAHRFAGAFLFPKEPFLAEFPRRLDIEHFYELKNRWRVSVAALIRRAYDFNLISETSYHRAHMLLNKMGERIRERNEPPHEFPNTLVKSMELLETVYPIEVLAARIGVGTADFKNLVTGGFSRNIINP